MKVLVIHIALFALTAYAQEQGAANETAYISECPTPNGYFADAVQCDKYYECIDDVLTEKLCPDGMAFNDLNPRVEKCDLIYQIDCKDRPELQIPKASENCPRENGYFPHPDPTNCGQFYYCSAHNNPSKLTCPEGLQFILATGNCGWPSASKRDGCKLKFTANFTCPEEKPMVAQSHPRYPDVEDCQFFYVCINGKQPRRSGCTFGSVFGKDQKACAEPRDVPDCSNYYFEYFKDYFTTLGGSGSRASTSVVAAAIASDYPIPGFPQRVINPSKGTAPKRNPAGEQQFRDPESPEFPRLPTGARPTLTKPVKPSRRSTPKPQTKPVPKPSPEVVSKPNSQAGKPTTRPVIIRRPGGLGSKRRRKKTTTPAPPTTTPIPEYYEDYYEYGPEYYDDQGEFIPDPFIL